MRMRLQPGMLLELLFVQWLFLTFEFDRVAADAQCYPRGFIILLRPNEQLLFLDFALSLDRTIEKPSHFLHY
jgi:hypothetical protein